MIQSAFYPYWLIPCQATYVLPEPYVPLANTSHLAAFASYNPSPVTYANRLYWYQRYSSYTKCKPRIGDAESFPLLCSAPANATVPLCQAVLNNSSGQPVLPPPICERSKGIQDVRLFVHSSGLWGLGSYKGGRCKESPILVKFDAETHQVAKYVQIEDDDTPGRRQKNWIVIDGSETADGKLAVIKRREPLSVAWIDVVTGAVRGTSNFNASRVMEHAPDESDFQVNDYRGSSAYIPFTDAEGRQGLLTTLHIRSKQHGYFNTFVFTERTWPFASLVRSRFFYLHDRGVVPWNGQRAEDETPTTQFLSGLAYSGDDRKTLLLGYGEMDCVSKVMRIGVGTVRDMLSRR
mmetsp:Transcript_31415/g.50724  ORF Transcript_31415/g.50724 Transcript_31415/m.50724 type:complete len:349 (+) Transcript_31415:344-1390(+)